MTKEIPLSKGYATLVDDEDYEWLSKMAWHVGNCGGRMVAMHSLNLGKGKGGTCVVISRLIMNAPAGMVVDHINHDTLDNRRCNLRVCTQADNVKNTRKISRTTTSVYKGVHYVVGRNRYKAQIRLGGKVKCVGTFKDPVKAARAYDKFAKMYYGEFACLNFPNE